MTDWKKYIPEDVRENLPDEPLPDSEIEKYDQEKELAQQEEARGSWLTIFPSRYTAEVDAIVEGRLPDEKWFRAFRAKWLDRINPWDSALIVGSTGAGKSVAGTWAAWREIKTGRGAAYLSALDIPAAVDVRRYGRGSALQNAREASLLVLDEVSSLGDAPWSIFAEVKAIINHRHSWKRATILPSSKKISDLEKTLGAEIINRFPLVVETGGKNLREGKS